MENVTSTSNRSMAVFSLVLFIALLVMRESTQYSFVFELMPVLGGSIPYVFLTLTWLILYFRSGGKLQNLGLTSPRYSLSRARSYLITLALSFFIVIVGIVLGALTVELMDVFIESPKSINQRKSALVGNLPLLILLTPLMWLVVLCEELLFRGLILNHLANYFGNSKIAWISSVFISAIIFGVLHFWQGFTGIIGAFVLAILWGGAYLLCKKNLWPIILAHAISNTIGFVATYTNVPTS